MKDNSSYVYWRKIVYSLRGVYLSQKKMIQYFKNLFMIKKLSLVLLRKSLMNCKDFMMK